MAPPRISILLLTLNGGPRLEETLAALARQTLAGAAELVVIDSGSTDQTLAAVQGRADRLHQLAPGEFGHGRTRNLAARLAQGEWLIYLSQDAVPCDDHWLEKLTRHLTEPEVAAVFGRQLPPADVGPIETFFLEQTYPAQAFEHSPLAQPRKPGGIRRIFFSNVNSAIKKSVWEQCPFPENVVMSEDAAFARAALAAGYRIRYDPEAAVRHGHRYTLAQLFRRNFDSGYSLREISADRWSDVIRLGGGYVWTELRTLARQGQWALMPYAVLYELVKSAGFAAGKAGHRLPAWLRPKLSLHRGYWASAPEP
ncbi:MAG: glycosyltransferase [Anaerolineales bacterium]|nr:glycosyltransferase [Anaerolineales bacterium]